MTSPHVPEKNPEWEKDPHVTPWQEERVPGPSPQTRKARQRTLRDWVVLGSAVLLLMYVVGFLLMGFSSSPSPSGSGPKGNFFSISPNLALIPIQGEIVSGGGSGTVPYSEIVDALDRAENDASIDGIFLDIDSPGGSVVASKQIVAKIRKSKKPVIAWIGELGASGGYYIAASSNYVLADADSITGSIGVISTHPNVKELFEKIGITMTNIKTGDLKDNGSPYKDMTEEEKQLFQDLVNQAFDGFVKDVKSFRGEKLNPLKFDSILDGRIVSGRQALEIGLIDQIGTREEAITKAGELTGMEGNPTLTTMIEKPFSLSDLFFSSGVQFGKGFQSSISSNVNEKEGLTAK